MASKSDILYEKNKYNRLRKRVDDLNGEINRLIKASDNSFDGKTEVQIRNTLNEGKRNIGDLREKMYALEIQLTRLADNLEREQKRLKAEEAKKEG